MNASYDEEQESPRFNQNAAIFGLNKVSQNQPQERRQPLTISFDNMQLFEPKPDQILIQELMMNLNQHGMAEPVLNYGETPQLFKKRHINFTEVSSLREGNRIQDASYRKDVTKLTTPRSSNKWDQEIAETPREQPQVDTNSEEARSEERDRFQLAIDILGVAVRTDAKPGWLTKDCPNLQPMPELRNKVIAVRLMTLLGSDLASTDLVERAFFFLQTRPNNVQLEEVIDLVIPDSNAGEDHKLFHCYIPDSQLQKHLKVGDDCLYCRKLKHSQARADKPTKIKLNQRVIFTNGKFQSLHKDWSQFRAQAKKQFEKADNPIFSYDLSGSTRAFKDSRLKSLSSVVHQNVQSHLNIEDQSSLSRSELGMDEARAFKQHKTLHSRHQSPLRQAERSHLNGQQGNEAHKVLESLHQVEFSERVSNGSLQHQQLNAGAYNSVEPKISIRDYHPSELQSVISKEPAPFQRQRQPVDERSLLSIVGHQRAVSIEQQSKQMTLNSKYRTQIIKHQGAKVQAE